MKELYDELHAVDGEDLVELYILIAPGGILYVHNVSVFATQPLVISGSMPRLDMFNSVIVYGGDTLPAITFRHTDPVPHRIAYCHFDYLRARPMRFIGYADDDDS